MANDKLHHSKEFLRKRYIFDRKTLTEIAAECDVSIQTISTQLRKFGLR